MAEVVRLGHGGPAEGHAPCFSCCNSFGLALADALTLALGDEGKDLEDEVGYKVSLRIRRRYSGLSKSLPDCLSTNRF